MSKIIQNNKISFKSIKDFVTSHVSTHKNIAGEYITLYEMVDTDGKYYISDKCGTQKLLQEHLKLSAEGFYNFCLPFTASYFVDLKRNENGDVEICASTVKDIDACLDKLLSCLIKINKTVEIGLEAKGE